MTALTLAFQRRHNVTSELTAELTSSMLGMISRSHSLRKESLSKEGSTFKISVRTSDISVLENNPPKHQITEAGENQQSFQGDPELFSTRPKNTRKQSEPVEQKILNKTRGGHFGEVLCTF